MNIKPHKCHASSHHFVEIKKKSSKVRGADWDTGEENKQSRRAVM